MTFELVCFYFFGAVAAAAALSVISVKNPVVAALSLVLTFFSMACVWLLAQAEFLAVALVLVYVGAVMVVLAGMSNMQWLGHSLFRDFLLPFEVAALILTVGLIAAIPLTLRKRSGIKTQNPAHQVRVKREDRIRLVKMDAVKKGEATP